MTDVNATAPADPTCTEWQSDLRHLLSVIVDFKLPAPTSMGKRALSPLEVFPHTQEETTSWLRNIDYPTAAENAGGRVTVLGRFGHLWVRVWLPLEAVTPAPQQPSVVAPWVREALPGQLVWS